MKPELTPFQLECESAVASELKRYGSRLSGRVVEGIGESYIRAAIEGQDAEVFIYEDEAGIQGPGTDMRFETPDYRSPSELIADVVGSVRSFFWKTDI